MALSACLLTGVHTERKGHGGSAELSGPTLDMGCTQILCFQVLLAWSMASKPGTEEGPAIEGRAEESKQQLTVDEARALRERHLACLLQCGELYGFMQRKPRDFEAKVQRLCDSDTDPKKALLHLHQLSVAQTEERKLSTVHKDKLVMVQEVR